MYIEQISGLQNFYIKLLIKSKTFVASFLLSLVIPVCALLIMYYMSLNLLSSSYIYCIVLIVISIVNIVIIAIVLFTNPITDSTDLTFIAKTLKRSKIYRNKLGIASAFLFTLFLIQSIIAVIFTASISSPQEEILAYWLISFFAQILIAGFLMPIIFLFSFKLSKVVSITINFLMLMVIVGSSLLSHFVFPDSSQNNKLINNDAYKMSYSQLVMIDDNGEQVDQQFVIAQNPSNLETNSNTNYKTNLNNTSLAASFMPGEWLMAPFQAMYMSVNYEQNYPLISEMALDKYKMGLIRFYNSEIINISKYKKDNYNYLPIRMQDNSIFNLNVADLTNVLINEIKSVISNSVGIIDFNSNEQFINFTKKINNNRVVWDEDFSPIEVRTISALVGLDGKHPALYYAFKYKDFISGKLNSLFTTITNDISEDFSNIYKLIFENSHAYNAILNNTHTSNFIDSNYPDVKTINEIMPPSPADLSFFKNILITWNGNQASILLNNNTRELVDINNMGIASNQAIKNRQDWVGFINNNATTITSLKTIYDQLKSNISTAHQANLISINYSPNYIDIDQYSYVSIIKQQSWIDFAYIYMIFIMLMSFILFAYSHQAYSKLRF